MSTFKRSAFIQPKGNFSCNRLHFTLKTDFDDTRTLSGEVLALTLFRIIDSFPDGTATHTLLTGVVSSLISHLSEHEEGFADEYQVLLDTECSSEANFQIFAAVIIGTHIDKYLSMSLNNVGEGVKFDDE